MKGKISWYRASNIEDLVEICELSFPEYPHSEREMLDLIGAKDNECVVFEYQGETLGYAIAKIRRSSVELLELAVHPSSLRRGIGSRLIDHIAELYPNKFIKLYVRETNLICQLWLRSNGFRAYESIHNHYEEIDELAIYFTNQKPDLAEDSLSEEGTNMSGEEYGGV